MAGKPGKRKLSINADKVDQYATDLRTWAARLAGVAKQMREEETGAIAVLGQSTADIGLGYFETLVISCERELRAKKKELREAAAKP